MVTPSPTPARLRCRITGAIVPVMAAALLFASVPARGHDGDHEHNRHGHAHDHDHGHTHLPVHYQFSEERSEDHAPAPAGDGHHWWKGNLHTHSLWSDGDQFPEVIADWYYQHGYHFLALSDHNVLSRGPKWINPETNRFMQSGGGVDAFELYRERFGEEWVESREVDEAFREELLRLPATGGHAARRPPDDQMPVGAKLVRLKPLDEYRHLFERAGKFILVEAEEITEGRHVVHVNATNIAERIEPRTGETVEQTIRLNLDAVVEQGEELGRAMLPHLNHPNFRWAVTAEGMAPVENLRFFEVYNGHRGVANFGEGDRPGLEEVWDIVLTLRLAEKGLGVVYGLAVDDAHHYEQSASDVARPGRGWVMVRSRYLTPEHLIGALEAGEFYSTTGVMLRRVESDGSGLSVVVDPEPGVSYTIEFIGTREGYGEGREPRLDGDGEPMDTTLRYSDDIGEVFAEVEGTEAAYTFQGDEIYVRARVVSSKEKENPFAEGEVEQAWVQPVVPE